MQTYKELNIYYGDLHNHCGISYGHGSIEEALLNAKEQLDFCSITGHALWPDMPEPDNEIQYIIDFHEAGFSRLRRLWPDVQKIVEEQNEDGKFVTFLSFEMHSCADGDRTIIYKGSSGEILEVEDLAQLHRKLSELKSQNIAVISLPHHIGYKQGQRGINWKTFDEDFSPVVEIISMHGCSEANENTRPFLHVMGPSDHESTMQYGLSQNHFFGVVGSTDHHSAHPGSYGHGRTGLWAREKTRDAIWDAICNRRTYALTGDRIQLKYSINNHAMGSRIQPTDQRVIEVHAIGGGPIDCIDIIKNGNLIQRFSEYNITKEYQPEIIRTKLYLEVGWGERKVKTDWDVQFGISEGQILEVEPRFRGQEVVSPLEKEEGSPSSYYNSRWQPDGDLGIHFTTTTFGNPNNSTNASQGVCLDVEMPSKAIVKSNINGQQINMPLNRLIQGARTGRLRKIGSAGYRFNRSPQQWEFDWKCQFTDTIKEYREKDIYYVRVRQKNDQWAWSSPIQLL